MPLALASHLPPDLNAAIAANPSYPSLFTSGGVVPSPTSCCPVCASLELHPLLRKRFGVAFRLAELLVGLELRLELLDDESPRFNSTPLGPA